MTTDVSPQQAEANRTITLTVYILHAASLVSGGIASLVAVIINYVKRDDVAGTQYADHFEWQIRTFWRALIAYVIGFALMFVVVGFVIMFVTWIWTLYRIIKGWLYLNDNKTLDPQAWF